MSDKPKKDHDIARKVWLAGIGAYGRVLGEAQDAYTKMGEETSKVFDELVGRGEDLENKVVSTAKNLTGDIAGQTVKATVGTVNDRMDRMKEMLGMSEMAAGQNDKFDSLNKRLDGMESKIDALIAAVQALSAAPSGKARSQSVKPKKTTKKLVKK